MEIIYLLIGIIFGAAAVFFILKYKYQNQKGLSETEAAELKSQLQSLIIENGRIKERNNFIEENVININSDLKLEREKTVFLNSELSSMNANHKNLQQKLAEQKDELEALQQKFTTEFKNIANELLEDKSKRFTEQNKENIAAILNPLNEKIKDFEKKVDDVYNSDTKQRATLAEQLKSLQELNIQMSKEANNLTNALKGQNKTQGNWGELILESVLEKSGLTKGREYLVQESMQTEDGRRLQPDVIINLPESRCLIIDSKVSLNAYERYCTCEDEVQRVIELKEHINSLKNHIKNLSSKNYQNLYQIKTLDFVLMFLPVEPAFSLAVQNELGLFNDAFEKNIVIVSPSTLLATLRTIASIWRQENQNKNALEIARQSGALYDKFEGLVKDLIDIGNKLKQTRNSYEDAMKKLHTGRGNLINSVEKIKKLGAKTTKNLPQSLLERADNNEDDETEEESKLLF